MATKGTGWMSRLTVLLLTLALASGPASGLLRADDKEDNARANENPQAADDQAAENDEDGERDQTRKLAIVELEQSHTFGEMRLIPIPQQNAARIRTILTQLQLDQQILQMGNVSVAVLRKGESEAEKADVEQAEKIIAKLSRGKERKEAENGDEKDAESVAEEEDAPAERENDNEGGDAA